MRWPVAAVWRQSGWNLGDPQLAVCRLDHHLGRELHAGSLKIETKDGFSVEAAKSAVEIAGTPAKEQAADRSQQRIAKIAVQRWHCSRQDAAAEAVSHHQLKPCAKLLHKRV